MKRIFTNPEIEIIELDEEVINTDTIVNSGDPDAGGDEKPKPEDWN